MVAIPIRLLPAIALFFFVRGTMAQLSSCDETIFTDVNTCINCFYSAFRIYACELDSSFCGKSLCDLDYLGINNTVVLACDYVTNDEQAVQAAYDRRCKQDSQKSGPSKGAIAGGVVGGLASIAAIGVVGAIIFHSTVAAIPALTKLGIVGAGVGASAAAGSAASGGASHSAGASGTGAAHGAHAGHAGHTGHAGHAANGSHASHAGQGANANAGAPGMGNGTTIGSASPGTGPAFAPDGGVGHSIGSAGQAPFGTSPDGGMSQMGPGVTGGQGAAGGPSFPGHGVNVAPSGSSAPLGASSAGGPGGAGMAPNASSVSPAATVPYAPPGAIRPSQTNRWRWLGRSRKEIADEEAQRREDERVALAGQMVQVPIVGSVTMGGNGVPGGPSFPALVPLPPLSTTSFPPSTPAQASMGALSASPTIPSSSLSSRSASYGAGLSTPVIQNAPLLSVDPPRGPSGDVGAFPQGTVLPSTIEYNTPRSGPYARLDSTENRQS